jgi:hypothetical protein
MPSEIFEIENSYGVGMFARGGDPIFEWEPQIWGLVWSSSRLSLDEAFMREYRSSPGNPDKPRRLICSGELGGPRLRSCCLPLPF